MISAETHVKTYGAVNRFKLRCVCSHIWDWQTAGDTAGDCQVMNTLLTSYTLYTGSQPTKINEVSITMTFAIED